MSEIDKEQLLKKTSYPIIEYESPNDALAKYANMPISERLQMGKAYWGFKEEPWYEKYVCAKDGFQETSTCTCCGANNLPESYQLPDLVKTEFPDMVSKFTPGVLVLAKNEAEGIIGFCAGGITTPEDLVVAKYDGNDQIYQSIIARTRLQPGQPFFYENEMVVKPKYQKNGVGSALNARRLKWIEERGINTLLGRTINPNLLKMKVEQYLPADFAITCFIPKGDTRMVRGKPRFCYFAKR